jgi:hypothetical protein
LRAEFAGLHFDLPDGWFDITDDLPDGTPFTLAREDGVGVIQFSVAAMASGADPAISESDLRVMCLDLMRHHGLGVDVALLPDARTMCVGGVAQAAELKMGAWFLSNGQDVGLVTYTSEAPKHPDTASEVEAALALVRSAAIGAT